MDVIELSELYELSADVEQERVPDPTVDVEANEDTYARVVLSPLPQGYGVTLGNPMRRILYRGLAGYAVAGVVFDNYAVAEDGCLLGTSESPDVICARLAHAGIVAKRPDAPRRGVLRLSVSGARRVVRLGDLECPEGYEIANPDMEVAEMTDVPGASLSASVSFLKGQGYVLSETPGDRDAGRYVLDRAFTPVRRVEYSVERMRVGASARFERLRMEVWTNGTVRALDAILETAASIGGGFGMIIAALSEDPRLAALGVSAGGERVSEDVALIMKYREPVERLSLGGRATNVLRRAGVVSVLDLLTLSYDDLHGLKGFGNRTYEEILRALDSGGYLGRVNEDSHWRRAVAD